MKNNFLFFCLAIIILTYSCGVVPIQSARVVLVENFTQSFDFGEVENKTPIINSLIDFDIYKSPPVRKKWEKEEDFISKGNAVITISLVPDKYPKHFYVSGFGGYDIYDTTNRILYFSAKFHIVDSIYYSLEDLELQKQVPIYFRQIAVNQFLDDKAKYALEPKGDIRIDTQFEKAIGQDIYSIKYDVDHVVSIGKNRIGTIRFTPPRNRNDKLIDLKKMKQLIRRNYNTVQFGSAISASL